MAGQSDAEFARQIHERLLAGDPVASAELADAYLELLVNRLRARFPNVRDEMLISDAATAAWLSYVKNPTQFHPAKSRLLTYLTMSARGDLLNALKKRDRQWKREVPLDAVEEWDLERNTLWEDMTPASGGLGADLEPAEHAALLAKVAEVIGDPRDRQVLQLMLEGERKTAVYAEVLGLQNHDPAEQRKMVKQQKDRLKKRLERLGVKLRERQP